MCAAIQKSERENRFSKRDRLLKRTDFTALSKRHQKIYSAGFIALIRGNELGRTRIGITASKKVGNAVVRNRIKRIIREFIRTRKKRIHSTWDINIIARHAIGKWPVEKMQQSLETILKRLPHD